MLLLPVMLFFLYASSQTSDSLFYHPDRYRLDLPKEWKKHKLIEAITDILPQTIDDLKDRDFCTECKAGYYVRLNLDSLTVSNVQTTMPVEIGSIPHYTFSFDYSFYAALMISDSSGKPFTMLRLVAPDEIMMYTKQFTLAPQNITYRYQNIYDTRGRVVGRRRVQEAGAMNVATPKISPFSIVTESFLLDICEQKIFEIKKILKKLNED